MKTAQKHLTAKRRLMLPENNVRTSGVFVAPKSPCQRDSPAEFKKKKLQQQTKKPSATTIGLLTRRFAKMLQRHYPRGIKYCDAAEKLGVTKRRLYDISNILEGVGLVSRKKDRITWSQQNLDRAQVELLSPYLPKSPKSPKSLKETAEEVDELGVALSLRAEVDELGKIERMLDEHGKLMQESLLALANDPETMHAYITHMDIRAIPSLSKTVLIVVKAPEGTRMRIPDPDPEEEICDRKFQIQLTSMSKEPIDCLLVDQLDASAAETPESDSLSPIVGEDQIIEMEPFEFSIARPMMLIETPDMEMYRYQRETKRVEDSLAELEEYATICQQQKALALLDTAVAAVKCHAARDPHLVQTVQTTGLADKNPPSALNPWGNSELGQNGHLANTPASNLIRRPTTAPRPPAKTAKEGRKEKSARDPGPIGRSMSNMIGSRLPVSPIMFLSSSTGDSMDGLTCTQSMSDRDLSLSYALSDYGNLNTSLFNLDFGNSNDSLGFLISPTVAQDVNTEVSKTPDIANENQDMMSMHAQALAMSYANSAEKNLQMPQTQNPEIGAYTTPQKSSSNFLQVPESGSGSKRISFTLEPLPALDTDISSQLTSTFSSQSAADCEISPAIVRLDMSLLEEQPDYFFNLDDSEGVADFYDFDLLGVGELDV